MYNSDFMDYETEALSPSTISSQSPASLAAQVDTQFVIKHNATAEIYTVRLGNHHHF